MDIKTITAARLAELSRDGRSVEIIDVRTPAEFGEVHVEGARNVPLDRLDPAAVMRSRPAGASDPLYVICRSGSRGRQACEAFARAGFSEVVNVDGGTLACLDTGIAVVRGRKAMSLERQVRIAAGGLVLLGSALAYYVHPGFLGVTAFVGAGLIYAGVTDRCGMGMIIAKMPWNQGAAVQGGRCS